jgi:hypothetical protein
VGLSAGRCRLRWVAVGRVLSAGLVGWLSAGRCRLGFGAVGRALSAGLGWLAAGHTAVCVAFNYLSFNFECVPNDDPTGSILVGPRCKML